MSTSISTNLSMNYKYEIGKFSLKFEIYTRISNNFVDDFVSLLTPRFIAMQYGNCPSHSCKLNTLIQPLVQASN